MRDIIKQFQPKEKSFQFFFRKKDLLHKLSILSQAARYDNTCSGSGRTRETYTQGLEGICYVWSGNGRCMPLLKILMTNICVNDCKYCINRIKNDIPRAIFSPEEVAFLTMEFYQKNYIKGLFLSSGIYRDPDYTMELMLRAVKILRLKYRFNGYIHLKLIPGSSSKLIKEAFFLADRVSSNLELPTEKSLKKVAPQKSFELVYPPLKVIKEVYQEKEFKASVSTQLIVGATSDPDKNFLKIAETLYQKGMVKRVYYSAYVSVNHDPALPLLKEPPFLREHRLYQADWLLRFYGFNLEELFEEEENLPLHIDPKLAWALRHRDFFPVEITKADYWELLRVPGIGPVSAKKLIQARKEGIITEDTLKNIGISLKRAKNFIVLRGKTLTKFSKNLEKLPFKLEQLSLF
ncbi:putative DNA modification/repair radical SAM protein [Thermodesulfobacterium sp. TA1]|uniref:putative DNA modification/repair radical SAM protein n=1 Tax=Thermodesulfobacterium sp. TA1 TaxID=2234087 RepID=UPI0012319671|nr:putative DNA modification/repair radical SAM protein [Thermodesulfobacterium sp. TA1]QER41407.1 putative DNA modification/repair radical SAM protein [Thermodesulfobacterium sp. TA1]